jgi:hypothetical protein
VVGETICTGFCASSTKLLAQVGLQMFVKFALLKHFCAKQFCTRFCMRARRFAQTVAALFIALYFSRLIWPGRVGQHASLKLVMHRMDQYPLLSVLQQYARTILQANLSHAQYL